MNKEVENTIPELMAADLATMVNVIDAGSQRGAWRGEELASLGALRDKLATIVQSMTGANVETNTDPNTEVDGKVDSEIIVGETPLGENADESPDRIMG